MVSLDISGGLLSVFRCSHDDLPHLDADAFDIHGRPYRLDYYVSADPCSGLKCDNFEGLSRVEGFICVVLNFHTKFFQVLRELVNMTGDRTKLFFSFIGNGVATLSLKGPGNVC